MAEFGDGGGFEVGAGGREGPGAEEGLAPRASSV